MIWAHLKVQYEHDILERLINILMLMIKFSYNFILKPPTLEEYANRFWHFILLFNGFPFTLGGYL